MYNAEDCEVNFSSPAEDHFQRSRLVPAHSCGGGWARAPSFICAHSLLLRSPPLLLSHSPLLLVASQHSAVAVHTVKKIKIVPFSKKYCEGNNISGTVLIVPKVRGAWKVQ